MEGFQIEVGEGSRDHARELGAPDVEAPKPGHVAERRRQGTLDFVVVEDQIPNLLEDPEFGRNRP